MNRTKYIGGSDIAAIMGLSPFKTALDVYLAKIEGPQPDVDKPCLARGRRLEKYILEEYHDRMDKELITNVPQLKSKEYSFLVGSPDAKLKDENVIVEAKSVSGYPKTWDNQIPIYYKTQVAFYAWLADSDRVDVAVLFSGWEFNCYTYQRDPKFEHEIVSSAIKFWNNHIVKGIPPSFQTIDDAKKLYPVPINETVEASSSITQTVEEIKEIEENIKSLEGKRDTLKLDVMNYMKGAEILTYGEQKLVSWKINKRNSFMMEEFKKQHSFLYSAFLEEKKGRVFRVF